MIEVVKILLKALFSGTDDGSYIELDKNMKAKLKIGAAISIFIFLTFMVLTLIFYFNWEPIKLLLNSIKTEVIETINKTDDFPKWIVRIVTFILISTFLLTMLFLYFLVDLARVHYRIDRITFNVIKKIEAEFHKKTMFYLGCSKKPNCKLREKLKEKKNNRLFMYEFFYFFTNQDTIGTYNQKDKRREIFSEWTKYYIFNFTFISLIFSYIWIGSLLIIKLPFTLLTLVTIFIALLVLIILLYIKIGTSYRKKLFEIGIHQLDIIFSEIPQNAYSRLKSVFGDCFENNCKIN